ncbi:MAG: hypothetical protein HFJ08_12585 [Lachnospiraceae bacterium]|nr:hypothetical protein [Lachnospiraceae bacterium]
MSESMETGGFGKSPAIDKINHLNSISSRMNAVSELEKKVFEPIQPKQKSVLQKRKEIADKFQISFKKKGEKQKYEPILHRGERKLSTEQYPARFSESGQDRFAIRTAGGVFPDGRRQTAQILPTKGTTGNNLGEQRWHTDNSTVFQTTDKIRSDTAGGRGTVFVNKGDVPKIRDITGIPIHEREASNRMVVDENVRFPDRTYQSFESNKRECNTIDNHIPNKGIYQMEKYHTPELPNVERKQINLINRGKWHGKDS